MDAELTTNKEAVGRAVGRLTEAMEYQNHPRKVILPADVKVVLDALTDALRRAEEAEAKVKRLKDALEPFAIYAGFIEGGFKGWIGERYVDGIRQAITYDALRRARKEWEGA